MWCYKRPVQLIKSILLFIKVLIGIVLLPFLIVTHSTKEKTKEKTKETVEKVKD